MYKLNISLADHLNVLNDVENFSKQDVTRHISQIGNNVDFEIFVICYNQLQSLTKVIRSSIKTRRSYQCTQNVHSKNLATCPPPLLLDSMLRDVIYNTSGNCQIEKTL